MGFSSVFAQKATKLPSGINSTAEELAPVFSHGGDTLFFVRNQHPENIGNQDIWFSIRSKDGSWTKAKNIGRPLNNESENAVCGISPDGKTLYLSNIYRGKKMLPGLSTSVFEQKHGWEMPRKVPIDLQLSDGYIGFSFPAATDSILLISMDNGGNEDLFFSRKNHYGEWEEPISLGEAINTDSTEFAPFLTSDGVTLYFASTGHGGRGSSDIFKSTRLDSTWQHWSVPQNLGKNVNSSGFEAYWVIHPIDSTAYFVHNPTGESTSDIWQIKLKDVEDTLQVETKPAVALMPPSNTELRPLPPFMERLAGIVLFDYKSAMLSDTAQRIVTQMLEQVINLPKAQFVVTGYADAVGESNPNLKLSEQRAIAIKNYLMSQGVPASRITTQAQGETYASNEQAPDSIRKQERRVEIVVREFR